MKITRVSSDESLQASVLDRLLRTANRKYTLRDMQQAVRRDLENLLNTRWPCKSWPPDLDEEMSGSLVAYGIPDFSAVNFGDPRERDEFRRILETVIRRFEPRFANVRLSISTPTISDRRLHFRVDALLRVEPTPEPTVFQTTLDPSTATFSVDRSDL
jgi:type VI secretion system protein ImpF